MLTKSQKIVYLFAGWIALALTLLVLFNSLDIVYFFIMGFLGFLVIVELSGPFVIKPKWRSRMDLMIAVGVVIFTVIVLKVVLDIVHVDLPI